MIRVTQSRQSTIALQSIMNSRARMQNAQQVAMSGQRVTKPSDDPAAAARARLLGELQSRSDSYRTTVSYGVARLQTAEQSLSEAGNVLVRAREIATAMASGTMSGNERTAAAAEVSQLRRSIIDLANTRHGDEYVFAHVDTRSPPYVDGVGFTYDTTAYDQVRRAEVGPTQTAEIGASGSAAFSVRTTAPGSVDVMAVLADLEANLTANDPDAIRGDIDQVTQAFDQVLTERTRTGVRMAELRRADIAAEQSTSIYSTLRSDLLDADAAESFSKLTLAENTMQAAVMVASRILGPSLLNAG